MQISASAGALSAQIQYQLMLCRRRFNTWSGQRRFNTWSGQRRFFTWSGQRGIGTIFILPCPI